MVQQGAASEQWEANRLVLRLEARTKNVSAVRRALERLDLPEGLRDDAQLLASELVTNAIRHGGLRPDDIVVVTAQWSGETLRVNVEGGAGPAKLVPVAGSIRPPPGAQSGWGLYLVDQLASRWGTNLGGIPGYWFELEAPSGTNGG
jgi:anti-sigma regulatory factor (Ser/Thr protein kinase)